MSYLNAFRHKHAVAISANSANSPPSEPIGTNGTIGTAINLENEVFERRVAESQEQARRGAAAYAAAAPDYEERAAIIEYDGKVSRPWAEPLARLCTMACPPAYSLDRWYRLIDDAGRFADEWAVIAEALGWTPMEVFGVGRAAPEARHDLKGLVALLDGWTVTAIAADKATVQNPRTGKVLSIYRKPAAVGQVMLWELRP
jgi:hypothetical protein